MTLVSDSFRYNEHRVIFPMATEQTPSHVVAPSTEAGEQLLFDNNSRQLLEDFANGSFLQAFLPSPTPASTSLYHNSYFGRRRANMSYKNISSFLLRNGESGQTAGAACIALAWMSIVLNLYVIGTLLLHRKRAFKNIFYLLVFHCAFVDCLRAASLIIWFLPEMDLFPLGAESFFRLTKIKQGLLVALRSLNMLTILNLLVFTVNEFIVVKKPLQYRRMVRRRMVATLLVLSWLLSFMFGLGSVLTRNYSPQGPMVLRNMTLDAQLNSSEFRQHITRKKREETEEPLQYSFIFVVIVVCVVCLLTVLTCYTQIMRRIRRFHRCDFRAMSSDSLRIRGSISSRGSNSERKRRVQVILRHKYLLVIGLVLIVDVLFLVPYSFIQIVQYVYISSGDSNGAASSMAWAESRWILQLLIALHSVLQPMCYFRMEDFRRLALCQKLPPRDWSTRLATMPAKTSIDLDLAVMTEDDEDIMMFSLEPTSSNMPLRHMDSRALIKAKLRQCQSTESSSTNGTTCLSRL